MARDKSKKRELRPIIPTLVGAGITEMWYFKHLRALNLLKISIRPRFFGREDITQLDKRIQDVLNSNGIAVAVFDTDTAAVDAKEAARLDRLRAKYANNDCVILCDSLPSIEYWFLLHYERVFKLFETSSAVITELRKYIHAYEKKEHFLKNEKWVKDMTSGDALTVAIQRAKESVNNNGAYSKIYRLFDSQEPHHTSLHS